MRKYELLNEGVQVQERGLEVGAALENQCWIPNYWNENLEATDLGKHISNSVRDLVFHKAL